MQGKGGGVAVPWAMLEARAFTSTADNDGSNIQRPILQRLFGPGVMDILGVRIDSVPVGRSRVAFADWRCGSGSGERRKRGGGGGRCNVLIRDPQAEATHRAIRIHARGGGCIG